MENTNPSTSRADSMQASSPQESSGQPPAQSTEPAQVTSPSGEAVSSTSSQPQAATPTSTTGGTVKGTVLVADDDITLRDMYQTRLETEGYQVIVAADGEETLNLVKEKKPAVVLLDIMMPKMNGLDVLAAMKKDETMKNIPVIILTALIQDLTKVKSLMSGADDYLMKSEVMPGEVIKKVEGVLEKSKGV